MIRIAIVEDDSHYSDTLKKYIQRYEQESGHKFAIAVYTDGEDIAAEYKGNVDIILMDIEMKFMDGLTAAEKIRAVDSEVVIIFITNMSQYAINGYAVDALDYVLKPINYFAFSQRIDRALTRMKRREKEYISLSVRGGVIKVDTDDLYYIEARNHDLIFHTKEGEIVTRSTLREVADKLDDKRFFRCSKCYLINLEYATGCQNNDVIVGNAHLQVSRARKKELLDVLNNYINEVSK